MTMGASLKMLKKTLGLDLIQELTCNGTCEPSSIAKGVDFLKQSSDCESNFDFLQ